jgi:hypothetical protein
LAGINRVQDKIDGMTRELERSYFGALKEVQELKDIINAAEFRFGQKESASGQGDVYLLDSLAGSLDELTDSLILRSKRAWQAFERLSKECEAEGFESARLDGLKALCKKQEELAANLLCYSLGRFKKTG